MTDETERYLSVAVTLDDPRLDVTSWEADFLESLLRWLPDELSPKQMQIIERMAFKYLGEIL